MYPCYWSELAREYKTHVGYKCEKCGHTHDIKGGYVLTVHHINGNKLDCRQENLIALCQRCHLREQGKLRRGVSQLALEQIGQLRLFRKHEIRREVQKAHPNWHPNQVYHETEVLFGEEQDRLFEGR